MGNWRKSSSARWKRASDKDAIPFPLYLLVVAKHVELWLKKRLRLLVFRLD